MKKRLAAIILAAGKGVRMRSSMPKALCELSGKPMVEFLIENARGCGVKDIVVIGGYKIDLLRDEVKRFGVKIIEQRRLLGSADAVKQAKGHFRNFDGNILLLYADTPLIKRETLRKLIKRQQKAQPAATLLTGTTKNPKDYGRVYRNEKGEIQAIVEYTEYKKLQPKGHVAKQQAHEVNIGAYCFDGKRLFEGLGKIKKNKIKGEYYLTDIMSYFYKRGYLVKSCTTTDDHEILGINRRQDLVLAEEILRKRTINQLLEKGITVVDPSSTFIQEGARIARDTVIYPFVVIQKGVVIGKGCKVGPFTNLRNGTVLKDGSEVGNFVEVVRSCVGNASKVKHHSYIGDAQIAQDVNIGAGTITANYNGKNKNRTVIEKGAFIGSGTTLVAPVKVGEEAITGAGSVVVKGRDVPPRTIVVGVPAKPLKTIKRE